MLRSVLIWLLQLNYLLVVGAGLVGRPEPVPQHATDYLHSADCQQRHYLQIDCFDHCNGEQYAVRKPGSHEAPLHFLSTLKGVDMHCLTTDEPAAATVFIPAPKPQAPRLRPAVPAGFGQQLYAPPRHGQEVFWASLCPFFGLLGRSDSVNFLSPDAPPAALKAVGRAVMAAVLCTSFFYEFICPGWRCWP